MYQSPVEWYGYETSPGPSGFHNQNGKYDASILQPMQQLSQTQEQQLHQYIQHTQQQRMQHQPMQHPQMQQQLMQQQPMQHPQIQRQQMQQQLIQQQPMQHPQIQPQQMQQQLMQHPQMQHQRVYQMMQPTSSVSQTSLQNHQHQTPLLTGLYPANVSRPPNPQTANPPTYHILQPVSLPSANVQPRCQDPPPTPQPPPGGLFSVMGAKSAPGSLSGTVKKLKRPMNAFLVWAKSERKLTAQEHPNKHNSEISKLLGQKWKALPIDQKQPFRDEAKRLTAQHMIDHPDYKYPPTKSKKKNPKQPSINGTQQGSGAFAPPGGNRGQPSFSESNFDLTFCGVDLSTLDFGDQDMASANGPLTYESLFGIDELSYPQIDSHNFIFQGYPPQNFDFSGLAPGYMSQSQLQSPIGGGQSRLAHQASQMPHPGMQIETTSPENHYSFDATLSPLDGPQ